MRIAVVTSHIPFIEGGHLIIARSTVRALREYGHEAELILTPQNRFSRVFQAYAANWLTDLREDGLGRPIDQVISFRYPSYAVYHPVHTNWLNHRFREYYDLWANWSATLSVPKKVKERIKRWVIHRLDNYLLKHRVTKIFAQSRTIQERLKKWGHIFSEVLYPPPPQRSYRTEKYGDFILTVSRLDKLKRLDQLIYALARRGASAYQLKIIGDGPERTTLERLVRELNLEERVSFSGWTDEASLLEAYAECRAVFFGPYQEDYGLVTIEAFASGKPVITCTDSGGPAELVSASGAGLVVPPDPDSIALSLEKIMSDASLAEKMGQQAIAYAAKINWEDTVKRLTLAG